MEETIKNLKRLTKKDLIRSILLFSDKSDLEDINLHNATKPELMNYIIDNYFKGNRLYTLLSSFTEYDLEDFYTSFINMDGHFTDKDENTGLLDTFYHYGYVSKVNHTYYASSKIKEVIENIHNDPERYRDKTRYWISCCLNYANNFYGVYPISFLLTSSKIKEVIENIHNDPERYRDKTRYWISCCLNYANNFYGVYPISFLLNLVNLNGFSFDEDSLLAQLDKIPHFARTIENNDYVECDEISFISALIDEDWAYEIERFQDKIDIYVPSVDEILTYASVNVIPSDAFNALKDKLSRQMQDDEAAFDLISILFDMNRISMSFEDFYDHAMELIEELFDGDTDEYEQLLKEFHAISPSSRYQGGSISDLDIRDLFVEALSSAIKYAVSDLEQVDAINFLFHLTDVIFNEIHTELDIDLPDLPVLKDLPLS